MVPGSSIVLKVGAGVAVSREFITFSIQLLRSIKCIICVAGIYQLLCVLVIEVLTLALPVRCIRTPFLRAFIGCQPAPFQAVNYILLCTFHITVLVSVFYSQYKLSAMMTCKKVII